MINKIIQILLIILFITIALINSHLLDLFGLENYGKYFWVNGNYEFTKVMYFNIFSGIILLLYFIKTIITKEKILIPKILYFILGILIISSILSIAPYISFFGNSDKSHSLLMFFNLIGIYILLYNSNYKFKKKILLYSFLGLFFSIILAIKEFFYPHFDYGNLSNRAIGTFGHPNYLALYLLLFIPIILENNFNKIIKYLLLILVIFTLFITKSLFANIILLFYLSYFIGKNKIINKKIFFLILSLVFGAGIFFILKEFNLEKLDSFISRFYIWKTTTNIIFSDFKTFIIGNGLGTLGNIFDNYKSTYLYIFENFGFTADRPHNIFLNIFFHFGIFGLLTFTYLIYELINNKKSIYKTSLILAIIFLILNYASITSYLIIILFISLLTPLILSTKRKKINILNYLIIFFIICFSIFGAYFSYNYYKEEHKLYNNSTYKINNFLIKKLYKDNIEKNIFESYYFDKNKLCENLITNFPSAENYIYCGNIFWTTNQNKAIIYYKLGLKKLPDLWNNNSKYFHNVFIKNNPQIIHRFFSIKYNNINIILKRLGIKK